MCCLQTEEEREWFASAMETRHDVDLTNQRKTMLANLMLKSQARACINILPKH